MKEPYEISNMARMIEAKADEVNKEINQLRNALLLIAAPMRPDGTYNLDRAACQKLAEEALK